MPRPTLLCAALLLSIGATACVSINLSSGSQDGAPTPFGQRPRGPDAIDVGPRAPTDPTPAPGDLPGPPSGTRLAGERRVCRTSSVPRGWIVVDYVPAMGECPARAGADSAATAAVLTRYAGLHRGATLEVCADQRTPRDWELVRDQVPPVVDASRCLGAVRDGSAPTRVIRRYR
ncbi:MAG: hypothetical protein ACXWZS_12630 [Gemmatirosa sp.]